MCYLFCNLIDNMLVHLTPLQIRQGTVPTSNSPVYTPGVNNIVSGSSPSEAAAIGQITKLKPITAVLIKDTNLPAFVTMPPSSAQLTNRLSNSPTFLVDSVNEVPRDDLMQVPDRFYRYDFSILHF